jgi:hypothetical protein
VTIAGALSCLDIDSLKIQKEEVSIILSGLDYRRINVVK